MTPPKRNMKKIDEVKAEKKVIQYQITFAQKEMKEWNRYLAECLKRLQKIEALEHQRIKVYTGERR